jgi:hypothetical protein
MLNHLKKVGLSESPAIRYANTARDHPTPVRYPRPLLARSHTIGRERQNEYVSSQREISADDSEDDEIDRDVMGRPFNGVALEGSSEAPAPLPTVGTTLRRQPRITRRPDQPSDGHPPIINNRSMTPPNLHSLTGMSHSAIPNGEDWMMSPDEAAYWCTPTPEPYSQYSTGDMHGSASSDQEEEYEVSSEETEELLEVTRNIRHMYVVQTGDTSQDDIPGQEDDTEASVEGDIRLAILPRNPNRSSRQSASQRSMMALPILEIAPPRAPSTVSSLSGSPETGEPDSPTLGYVDIIRAWGGYRE